jgi:hypothetical protein
MPRDGYKSLSIEEESADFLDDLIESNAELRSRAEAVSHIINHYRGDDTDHEGGVHVASVDPDVVTELARASGEDVEGRLS